MEREREGERESDRRRTGDWAPFNYLGRINKTHFKKLNKTLRN